MLQAAFSFRLNKMLKTKSNQVQKAQSILLVAAFFIGNTAAWAIGPTPTVTRTGTMHTTTGGKSSGSSSTSSRGISDPGKNTDSNVRPRLDAQFNRTNDSARPLGLSKTENYADAASHLSDDKSAGIDSLSHLLITDDDSKSDSSSDRDDSNHNMISDSGDHGDDASGGNSKSDSTDSSDKSDSSGSSSSSNDSSSSSDKSSGYSSKSRRSVRRSLIGQNGRLTNTNLGGVNISSSGGSSLAGAGDASNVSGGSTVAIASDVQDSLTVKMHLQNATAFVAHKKTVILHTPNGDIKITPGAIAYVVQMGKEVSVYNFSDTHRGDIAVILPSKKIVPVPYGHHVLLTQNVNSKFEEVTPAKSIVHNNVKNIGTQEGLNIFDSQFSPTSALDSAYEFRQLIKSPTANDKKIANQILKSAAIISNLSGQ